MHSVFLEGMMMYRSYLYVLVFWSGIIFPAAAQQWTGFEALQEQEFKAKKDQSAIAQDLALLAQSEDPASAISHQEAIEAIERLSQYFIASTRDSVLNGVLLACVHPCAAVREKARQMLNGYFRGFQLHHNLKLEDFFSQIFDEAGNLTDQTVEAITMAMDWWNTESVIAAADHHNRLVRLAAVKALKNAGSMSSEGRVELTLLSLIGDEDEEIADIARQTMVQRLKTWDKDDLMLLSLMNKTRPLVLGLIHQAQKSKNP